MSEATSEKRPVLDHGYVRLVESWGSDERIIEAARMSTGKGFLGWGPKVCPTCKTAGVLNQDNVYHNDTYQREAKEVCVCVGTGFVSGDEKLLHFLWKNGHTSPFEMCGASFEIAAPIFVFREWHRHRTQSYNELSARYTPIPQEDYVPTRARCNPTVTANKQAAASRTFSGQLTEIEVDDWLLELKQLYERAQDVYTQGLALGIPKELARLPVPVGRYSRMRASANLLNWLRFVSKRATEDAQWEIRQYAFLVQEELEKAFPRTMEIFGEGGSRV